MTGEKGRVGNDGGRLGVRIGESYYHEMTHGEKRV